jgi:hypothetical protein
MVVVDERGELCADARDVIVVAAEVSLVPVIAGMGLMACVRGTGGAGEGTGSGAVVDVAVDVAARSAAAYCCTCVREMRDAKEDNDGACGAARAC